MIIKDIFSIGKKMWLILDKNFKHKSIKLSFMIILGTVIEVLGLGLFFPILEIISNPNFLNDYSFVLSSMPGLLNYSQIQLITFSLLFISSIYTIKVLYLGILSWIKISFTLDLRTYISSKLFSNYLNFPYTFHMHRNSAHLIRNIVNDTGNFSSSIGAIITLVSEVFVVLGILILLFYIEPKGALSVISILGLFAWMFYFFIRNKILEWGESRQYHDGMRIQHVQQGLDGYKEVKLFGRELNFVNIFQKHNIASASSSKNQDFLRDMPRLLVELLMVFGMTALILLMISSENSISSIIPTLGIFALSAFRIMPSMNRILSAVQEIRYMTPVVETLFLDWESNKINKHPISSLKELAHEINIDSVDFVYPKANKQALNSLNMKITKGSSIGIIGPSGSGKSTLVNIILGLIEPTSGQVKIDGTNIQNNLRSWQDQIGYVPQDIYLTDSSLKNNIAFGIDSDQIDLEKIDIALKAASLVNFVEELSDGIETFVGEKGLRLSGGQRQRIAIARALYHNPQILILDEATSALDFETEREILKVVKNLHGHKTIIMIAHRHSTIQECDLIYEIKKGQIIKSGSTKDMLN